MPTVKIGNGHYVLIDVNPLTKEITYYDGILAMQPYDPESGDEDVEKLTAHVFSYVKVSRSNKQLANLINDMVSFVVCFKKDAYSYHRGEELPDEDLWRVGNQTAKNTPMQRNLKDCGILQCITMNYLCEDLPFNYDSTQCPLFRKKMAVALMTNISEYKMVLVCRLCRLCCNCCIYINFLYCIILL